MKKALFIFLMISYTILVTCKEVKSNSFIDAVNGLVSRRYPKLKDIFTFEVIEKAEGDKDVYEIESQMASTGKVIIRGNNGVSLSTGLGYYMRYHAHTQISWTGDQLINAEPDRLPKTDFKERVVSPLKYSYYMNTCTHSYSAAWWDWERWEKEIDWMVLQGVNFPLAFVGQEYILYKLFTDHYGLTDQDLNDWLTGPAFFAWFRMGNIQKWGGPISMEYMKSQRDLQIQILARMREFGMLTILPMFTGFVPYALKLKYPNVTITQSEGWSGFYETEYRNWNLDASEPLFNQIAQKYIELEIMEYGTDHFYNGDMFNEMEPQSSDLDFLERAGRGTIEGLLAGDSNATWVMQGWLFWNEKSFWQKPQVKAYLSGVPNDKMIILDLYTEKRPVWDKHESYYGKSWIWCSLINFGGNPPLRGDVKYYLSQPHIDRDLPNSTMIGIGITMEAIDQNYIDYESTLEAKWRDKAPESVDDWVQNYVHYRYGDEVKNLKNVQDGWTLIHKNIYDQSYHNGSYAETRPNLPNEEEFDKKGILDGVLNQTTKGWGLLLQPDVVEKIGKVETYIIDVVDIGTYCLEATFDKLRISLSKAYKNKDLEKIEQIGTKMLDIIKDLDKLNMCSNYTLLGKWINDARKMGKDEKEKDLFEYNARVQVTTWHNGVENCLNDYAKKSWSGLYSDYYLKRWTLFIDYIKSCVEKGEEYNQDAFNFNVYFDVEEPFSKSIKSFTPVAVGDAASVGQEIYKKYFADERSEEKVESSEVKVESSEEKEGNDFLHNLRPLSIFLFAFLLLN